MLSKELNINVARTIGVGILLAGGLVVATHLRTASAAPNTLDDSANFATAISYPSEKSQPPFFSPGIISDILVKEGDAVHKGDLLMTEDAAIEKDELDALKTESDSTKTVEYAMADHDAKVAELQHMQAAADKGVVSPSELAEAIANEKTTAVRIDLAKEESQKAKFETQKQADKVARMELRSPIDGIIETINLHRGSGVDPSKPDGACVIVQNDPLWVEMRLPSAQAAALKKGQTMDVRYNSGDKWRQGTIIFFNPVVDAASDTRIVRLEVPNPDQMPSGLHLTVRLPADVAALSIAH
jgi:RND family efflux transporter MFP subunit